MIERHRPAARMDYYHNKAWPALLDCSMLLCTVMMSNPWQLAATVIVSGKPVPG